MIFLQEIKIASSDSKTQEAVRIAVNTHNTAEKASLDKRGPTYDVFFTLPNDPHNARGLRGNGKVYGVCSIIRSDLSATSRNVKVRTVDWDKEGRVSVIELDSPSFKLALYNIYAVNGTDNPYRDPETGAVLGTRHDRKLAFHRLLMEECKAMEAGGREVLLVGDFNVALDARDGFPKLRTFPQQHVINRNDFLFKFMGQEEAQPKQGFGGLDVWRQMHGDERRYTYFPRNSEWGSSCDRIDYIIAGRGFWEKQLVKACGILDSEEGRGPSDHVPIWIDISSDGKENE